MFGLTASSRCRKKGHNWQLYGWSVMGFGPYRYHYQCTRCKITIEGPEPEVENKDESASD